jgi:hypothetical protein
VGVGVGKLWCGQALVWASLGCGLGCGQALVMGKRLGNSGTPRKLEIRVFLG